jgi:hypothetical protein
MTKEERRARYLAGAISKAHDIQNIIKSLVIENLVLKKRNKYLQYKSRQKDKQILNLVAILKSNINVEENMEYRYIF